MKPHKCSPPGPHIHLQVWVCECGSTWQYFTWGWANMSTSWPQKLDQHKPPTHTVA